MNIGIPKEVRTFEYRVGLTPEMTESFTNKVTQSLLSMMLEADQVSMTTIINKQEPESSILLMKYLPGLTWCLKSLDH